MREGKRCVVCGVMKGYGEYSVDRHNPDGLEYRCRVCKAVAARSYYHRNKEKVKTKTAARKARIKADREQGPVETARRKREAAYHMARKYWRMHQGDHTGLAGFLYRPADLLTMRERPPLFSLMLQSKI